MRFREEKLSDLAVARKAVAEWRVAHPEGTPEQLIGAVGPAFPSDWSVVLRGILAAVDRHGARRITGITVEPETVR
jgi:hypothetical protein